MNERGYTLDYIYDWDKNKKKNDTSNNIKVNKENNYNAYKNNNKNNIIKNKDNNNKVKDLDNKKKIKSYKNNIKSSFLNKRDMNNNSKLNHTFHPKISFKQKEFKTNRIENKKIKNKINSLRNKNQLIKSSEKRNEGKNLLKKNSLHDTHILENLLNNEIFDSIGFYTNESHNFKHLNNNHYKFLSGLNTSSKKCKEIENRRGKSDETKKIKSNKNINNESKDNNCIVY